jgi:hypothetical protein
MVFRDLEKIRFIIKDSTGLDLTYAYDDLVFPEHVAFLIQFDDAQNNNYFCYFHEDCLGNEQTRILKSLTEVCRTNNCTISAKGSFNLQPKGEEFEVHFL